MLERDPLAAEFAALRAAVLARPPGPAAAERTVRRRRRRGGLIGAAVVVAVVAAVGVALAGFAASPRRVTPAVPVLGPTSQEPPGPRRSPEARAVPEPCRPAGALNVGPPTLSMVSVRTESPYPLCPGERIRLVIAVYTVDAAGTQHLYRVQVAYLDRTHTAATLPYRVPACRATIYLLSGDQPVLDTIPPMADFARQAVSAYGPDASVVWAQEEDAC